MVVMWLGFFRLTAGFQSDTKMHQLMTPKTGTALNLYFTSAFIFGCVVSHGAVMPGDDFNANTTTGASTLQRWYNHKGLWDTTGWWNAANCVEAVENAIVANNGQSYLDVISNTFNLNAAGGFLNDYYDDEGWWALAWIRAYDLTGNIQYLSMAKTIFKDMTGGWNDHCDGGLGWRKSRPSKNAVQNELFLLVAIRLHQRTPGDGGAGSYFDWAIREWDWFKHSGLINSQNLVYDGLNRNCENNGRTTWTYYQGVFIGGLTDLYKTTGDSNYLAQATAIADATISTLIDKHGVLREPCESGDCGGGDGCGRGHEDLRARRSHPALEVARTRGDAHVVLAEHAHVSARTRAARRGRDHGARLH